MAAVTKNDESLVELRTDVGRLYVRPTSWQRLYLQWTFRNFHHLPQQVLNGRQQRLIDKLWRTAIVTPAEPVAPGNIVGVVENMHVLAMPSATEAAAPKTAEPAVASRKFAEVRSRAGDAVVTRASATGARVPSPPPTPALAEISADPALSTQKAAGERSLAGRGFAKRGLWALGSAGAIAALLLAFQLVPIQELPPARLTPPAVPTPSLTTETAAPAAGRSAVAAKREIRQEPGVSQPAAPVEKVVAAEHSNQATRPSTPARAAAGTTASSISDSQSLPRIVEAPRSGFIYPVAPNPNLVGKVMLKAVIGSDGAVKEVEVLSGDRSLAAAAARAVRQWRYAPAEMQGRPVEAETQVTISFLGDDAVSIIVPSRP